MKLSRKTRPPKEERHKGGHKKLKAVIIAIVILLVLFVALIGFITDFLWFKELDYVGVFFTKLFTQLKIGVPTFIVITFLTYVYFKLIKKSYYKKVISNDFEESRSINAISWLMAAIFGAIVTFFAVTLLWFSALQFFNSTDFGYDDPLFGLDVSFYIFKLDFLRQLNTLIIIVLAAFLIFTVLYYMVLMGTRHPRLFKGEEGSTGGTSPGGDPFKEYDRFSDGEYSYTFRDGKAYRTEAKSSSSEGSGGSGFSENLKGTPFEKFAGIFDKVGNFGSGVEKKKNSIDSDNIKRLFTIASKQITIMGTLLFIMLAVHFLLKQFELLYGHRGAVYGAGFTDVTITLWMYRLLIVLSLVGAVSVVVGVAKHKLKMIVVVPVVMIAVNLLGVGGAYAVQNLIVSPNEIARESEYLERNIEFTQKAYGLEDVKVQSFEANDELTGEDIANNQATISNIRINDYEPAETFYNQTQSIRQYYTFHDVDVDRYMVNGEYTQTFLSAREIDEEKISQTWLNKHLKYTHGYGVTLSRVDEITASGQPEMLIKNIPPTSQVEEISIDRPEIYFGEMTNEYAIVGTNEDEFDYPDGDENKYTQYEGTAGIKLNLINRLMFTIKEKNPKILVSSNIDGDSKIIINRNISDRVQKIMPYLQYDNDPYIVTEGGKLYWIIDAYTTSTQFPYSEPYDVDNTKTNYVRNSVKVIIDAYNGTVDYYVVDKEDPIAATFSKIYPELFKDGDDMPEGLKAHMRYPNQLFDTQAKVYSRYHMEDVRVFYQNEDQWDIAKETYGTEEKEMEPNYYIMNLPGESEAEFVNSVPFTPKDKKNMAGLMVARNDGDNYGELILYQLPKNKVVYGPQQVEAQIDQDPEISKEFSLWNSSGSKYSRGNMFVIPIEESLLYVEPVYLEASESSIPEVKRVIVVYGDRIAYEPTLAEALNSLFGDGTIEERDSSSGSSSDSKDSSSGGKASMTELIQSANDAFDNAVKAQESGDWAKYGEYLDELEGYLKELEK